MKRMSQTIVATSATCRLKKEVCLNWTVSTTTARSAWLPTSTTWSQQDRSKTSNAQSTSVGKRWNTSSLSFYSQRHSRKSTLGSRMTWRSLLTPTNSTVQMRSAHRCLVCLVQMENLSLPNARSAIMSFAESALPVGTSIKVERGHAITSLRRKWDLGIIRFKVVPSVEQELRSFQGVTTWLAQVANSSGAGFAGKAAHTLTICLSTPSDVLACFVSLP